MVASGALREAAVGLMSPWRWHQHPAAPGRETDRDHIRCPCRLLPPAAERSHAWSTTVHPEQPKHSNQGGNDECELTLSTQPLAFSGCSLICSLTPGRSGELSLEADGEPYPVSFGLGLDGALGLRSRLFDDAYGSIEMEC